MFKIVLSVWVLTSLLSAQVQILSTPFTFGLSCNGNMFDVTASADVTVCSFDVHLAANATDTFRVYGVTSGGSWNVPGVSNNPNAWTLLATVTVTSAGTGVPTPLNLSLGHPVAAGTTQGFYVVSTTGPNVNYLAGTAVGTIIVSDGNLAIREGSGDCTAALFAPIVPRRWNGRVHYALGLSAACPPPNPLWESNSPESSLSVNGVFVQPGGVGPAVTTLTTNQVGVALSSTTLVGAPYDLAVVSGPALPRGGGAIESPGGQLLNLDFGQAVFLNSGNGFPNFLPHPGSFTASAALTVPGVVCGQQGVVDAGSPDGIRLSQCSQLVVVATPCAVQPTNIGAGDDTSFQYSFAGAGFTFYGVTYSTIFVGSNGNLTFTSANLDFTPTESELLSQQPRIAPAWDDWDPSAAGTVTLSEAGGVFRVAWDGVPHLNSALANGFCVTLDLVTGSITLGYGLTPDLTTGFSGDVVAGISPGGSLGMSNNVDLSIGPNVGITPTDPIYEAFGLNANGPWDLALRTLVFTPSGAGSGPYVQF